MKATNKQTYKIFWRHGRKYKGALFLMVTSVIAATLVSAIIPLYYKQFFDTLTDTSLQDQGLIAHLTSIIIFILILQTVVWLFYRVSFFVTSYVQTSVMTDLTNTSFEYLHQHSYRFFTNRFVGALVRKVSRLVDAFESIADRVYWDLLPLAVRLGVIFVVVWSRNPTLAYILLVWTAFYMSINYAFTIFKLKYDALSAEINTEVNARLADTVTNNINIKIFSALGNELGAFRGLTEEQRKMNQFTWNLSGYMEAIQGAFMIGLEFIVFYFAIRFWSQGLLTIGDFVLVQDYLIQIFSRLWDFGRIFRDIYKNLANAQEMTEILNEPHEVRDRPNAKKLIVSAGEIRFQNINFTYTKTRNVIKNFNLRIAPGEKIGIVGPSGAGKSTLLALLLRFYDTQPGAIFIDGQNIADVTQDSLRSSLAFVPQDPILFHRTLKENVRYGRLKASDEEVIDASRLAHCDEFIEQLSEGYQTFVGERGVKLSGGERQRVAIARAILKNAPILLLDEATSSLDSHSERLIQDALATLMEGKTTIVIAHRLSTIMKMDRIIVLKDGSIIEEGGHHELLGHANGAYQKLWKLQAGGFIA